MVFHWSLSDSKSPKVSRTLLSFLADLNYSVVCMVYTRPLISNFKPETSEISYEKTRTWLWKGTLKKLTESLLIAVRNNAIMTCYIKGKINITQHNNNCTLCGDNDETINDMINKYIKLAQNVYKITQVWMWKGIPQDIVQKIDIWPFYQTRDK